MCGQADLELTFSAFELLKLQAGTIVPDMGDICELIIKTQDGNIGQVWWFMPLSPVPRKLRLEEH